MKVKCPTCGATGTDVPPSAAAQVELLAGAPRPEDDFAFAVHGRHGRRAVRKCLNCGSGVYVKLLPPRYQAIPPTLWERMEKYFAEQMAESSAHIARVIAEMKSKYGKL